MTQPCAQPLTTEALKEQRERLLGWVRRHRGLVALIKQVQQLAGLVGRGPVVKKYLREHEVRKLQIGAHMNSLPGWLNTDLYPQASGSISLDATRRFPLADSCFDYVFSEHQLEHISYTEGFCMLSECHRVLRPGGVIRIAVPAVESLLRLFGGRENWTPVQEHYVAGVMRSCFPDAGNGSPCFALNAAFLHWGHRFMYDFDTLRSSLERAGFVGVEICEPGESSDTNLRGLEFRTAESDCYETLVVEAKRPGTARRPI